MSGNGNHGTVNGATLTTDRYGFINKAYEFDGLNDWIEVPPSSKFADLNQYTIAVWVKVFDSLRRYNFLVAMRNSEVSLIEIYGGSQSGGTGLTISHNRGFSHDYRYISKLPNNLWNHLVVTFDGSNTKRYSNGKTIENFTGLNKPENKELTLFFGRTPVNNIFLGSSYFQGIIDDIKIYVRCLNSIEVDMLFKLPQ